MTAKPIYVEILIHSDLEALWEQTQNPTLHERWDLRFSNIEYLPQANPKDPQQFLYSTQIGFGLKIEGKGESVGHTQNPAERSSVLKFWSDHPLSLIRKGSGYWKYISQEQGIRFLTYYDYQTRFGVLGKIFDRLIFRPLMGWATAFSFDRLRLCLEENKMPEETRNYFLIHWIARLSLVMIWLYHGIVPKLLFKDSGELAILQGIPFLGSHAAALLSWIGLLEIFWALALLGLGDKRWMQLLNIVVLIFLLAGACLGQAEILVAPFNPITTSLGMIALSLVAIFSSNRYPQAKNCLRKAPR